METGKPIHFRREIGELHADVVLLMDVLEHVEDDVGLLRQYVEKVPSGARFLISVPAFQVLWSDHDVFLEHKRRYTVAKVEHVVSEPSCASSEVVIILAWCFLWQFWLA